jgi:HSP20 family protein
MADVDVKKQQQQESGSGQQIQRGQGQSGVTRRREQFGFPFISPAEFFTASPFALMRRMNEEMDRMWSRFSGEGQQGSRGGTWLPAIEVSKHNNEFCVHAELPGLKPEDVNVEITDDAIILQGERKSEQEQNESGVYRSERQYGQFYREIPLPEGASAEQAKAEFNNGVLEVTIPIAEQQSNRRRIPVQSATSAQGSGAQQGTQQSTGQQTTGQQSGTQSGQQVKPPQAA